MKIENVKCDMCRCSIVGHYLSLLTPGCDNMRFCSLCCLKCWCEKASSIQSGRDYIFDLLPQKQRPDTHIEKQPTGEKCH